MSGSAPFSPPRPRSPARPASAVFALVPPGGIVGQVNSMLLRPFRQQVDMVTVALVLVLLLAASGMWRLVLERIDMPSGADLIPE